MKKLTIVLFLSILTILTCYRLFRPGYLSMQDDIHIFRLEQYHKCLQDRQIPCRYIPDGGLGYGYPLFNYYSPLTYSFAEFFHLIGFSFINSIKAVIILAFFLGTIGMFLFASYFWGNLGGLVSAVVFSFSPYRAVDSFVRGAIAEFFALNLFPLIFWSITRYLKTWKPKYFLLSLLFLTSLFLCHNLMIVAIMPVLLVYILIFLYQSGRLEPSSFLKVLSLFGLSFGLSAFFLLPAFFEKNLVTVDTMTQGFFNFINHFASLPQLFLLHNNWGYGASTWGMSLQIGYIQWLLPLLVVLISFLTRFKNKIHSKLLIYFFFLVFLFYAFLVHNKSTFIWLSLPFMAYFQFPWRFLAIVIFSLSFISGAAILFFNNTKASFFFLVFIFIGSLALNFNFFKEDIWFPHLTDQQKLSGAQLIQQTGAGLKDYWPKGSLNFPTEFADNRPRSDVGSSAIVTNYLKSSNLLKADINVSTASALITYPLVYFPDWRITVDGQPVKLLTDNNLGLIQTRLSSGNHHIVINFYNTPIRNLANLISLISLIVTAIYFFIERHEI